MWKQRLLGRFSMLETFIPPQNDANAFPEGAGHLDGKSEVAVVFCLVLRFGIERAAAGFRPVGGVVGELPPPLGGNPSAPGGGPDGL